MNRVLDTLTGSCGGLSKLLQWIGRPLDASDCFRALRLDYCTYKLQPLSSQGEMQRLENGVETDSQVDQCTRSRAVRPDTQRSALRLTLHERQPISLPVGLLLQSTGQPAGARGP